MKTKTDTERRSNLFSKKDTTYSFTGRGYSSQRFNYREAGKQGKPVFQGRYETA